MYKFDFVGDGGYESFREDIRAIIFKVFADEDEALNFYFAVNEAVYNAAAYGLQGCELTRIVIDVRVFEQERLEVAICSETVAFDVKKYLHVLLNTAWSKPDAEWTELVSVDAVSGRGFWIMLVGADEVRVSEDGQRVCLRSAIPKAKTKDRRGSHLLQKFSIVCSGR